MGSAADAKAALAKDMAKKPSPKPAPKGSISDQVVKKYGKNYGNTPPFSKKWMKMANDSLFGD